MLYIQAERSKALAAPRHSPAHQLLPYHKAPVVFPVSLVLAEDNEILIITRKVLSLFPVQFCSRS